MDHGRILGKVQDGEKFSIALQIADCGLQIADLRFNI